MRFESDLLKPMRIHDVPAIEDECRAMHVGKDAFHIELLKLIPFGQNRDGMSPIGGFIGAANDLYIVLDQLLAAFGDNA